MANPCLSIGVDFTLYFTQIMKNNSSKNPLRGIKGFVLQQDESDCGVACLLSIIRYHGGESSLERLRESSGTSIQGTSLLGLQ